MSSSADEVRSKLALVTGWGAIFLFSALFMAVIFVLVGRKVWNGESELDGDFPPADWPFGKPSWRGAARSYTAAAPCLVLILLAFTAQELLGTETAAGDVALVVGTVLGLGALLIVASITPFNRPRLLVPPHLRSEPGLLAERRRRRTSRRGY